MFLVAFMIFFVSACSGNNNGVIDDSGKSGIRPVLNLHKNVNITDLSQNGTIENPYIIENDPTINIENGS